MQINVPYKVYSYACSDNINGAVLGTRICNG